MAYHLLSLYESYSFPHHYYYYYFSFLYEFWDRDISRTESTIMLQFHSIYVINRNSSNHLIYVITQP